MSVRVARYSLGWNPKRNVGRVSLTLESGKQIKLQFDSAAEFGAGAAVLREADVLVANTGFIYAGAEILEEGD